MRAACYDRFGPANEVLNLENLPTPTPANGEVLVRLAFSGVNPSDVKVRAGGRPGVTKPAFAQVIPHSDGAGVIEAVGEGVDPSRIGQRVWIWNGQWQRAFGTAAEYIAIPAEQAVTLPDETSLEIGAILGIPAMTAVHAVAGGDPVAGKTVLISGGAGTVGHLAIQVAKAEGASVIATASGAGIDAARKAGADHVLDYSHPDLPAQILEATEGALIDRVVEVEFGRNAETIAQVIAEGGSIAAYGSAQDMSPTLPFYPLMFKSVTLQMMLVYLLTPARRTKAENTLFRLLQTDSLNFRIAGCFELSECAQAHDLVAKGKRTGAVLLQL